MTSIPEMYFKDNGTEITTDDLKDFMPIFLHVTWYCHKDS